MGAAVFIGEIVGVWEILGLGLRGEIECFVSWAHGESFADEGEVFEAGVYWGGWEGGFDAWGEVVFVPVVGVEEVNAVFLLSPLVDEAMAIFGEESETGAEGEVDLRSQYTRTQQDVVAAT
jgi:hypothetical protein